VKRDIETRLRKLEADRLPTCSKPHRMLIGASEEECEVQRLELIESGRAEGSDEFSFVVLVGVAPTPCLG
jgi:hypothetical protein